MQQRSQPGTAVLTNEVVIINDMRKALTRLYQEMLLEIGLAELNSIDELTIVEHCFNIGMRYRNVLAGMSYPTESMYSMEPLFTSVIDYNIMRYQAILFKPTDTAELAIYWQHELERIDAIFQEHDSIHAVSIKAEMPVCLRSWKARIYASVEYQKYVKKELKRLESELPAELIMRQAKPAAAEIWNLKSSGEAWQWLDNFRLHFLKAGKYLLI